jgi:hypothetical protein
MGFIGRALCESDTWITNKTINDRFRALLKHRSAPRGITYFRGRVKDWQSNNGVPARWPSSGRSVIIWLIMSE